MLRILITCLLFLRYCFAHEYYFIQQQVFLGGKDGEYLQKMGDRAFLVINAGEQLVYDDDDYDEHNDSIATTTKAKPATTKKPSNDDDYYDY